MDHPLFRAANAPFIIRMKNSDEHAPINVAYVHRIMYREALIRDEVQLGKNMLS
jgi:hypothetical protein